MKEIILMQAEAIFRSETEIRFTLLPEHHDISREEISSIAESKEVCPSGFAYRDAFGNETTYKSGSTYLQPSGSNLSSELVSKITEEVLKKIKNS